MSGLRNEIKKYEQVGISLTYYLLLSLISHFSFFIQENEALKAQVAELIMAASSQPAKVEEESETSKEDKDGPTEADVGLRCVYICALT
jgi:hypothetical protein